MSGAYRLVCFVQGDNSPFHVIAPLDIIISELRKEIQKEKSNLREIDASSLILWKVLVPYDEDEDMQNIGKYQPTGNDQALLVTKKISKVWSEPPPDDHLHVFVTLPAGLGNPTLVQMGADPVDPGFVGDCEDIFIKVNRWGAFESSDIQRNEIHQAPVQDFVANLERELDSKPGLDPDTYDLIKGIRNTQFLDAYFGRLSRTIEGELTEEFTVESGGSEPPQRFARRHEVAHLAHIASCDWERSWKAWGLPLRETLMNVIFFGYFVYQVGGTITAQTGRQPWPFTLVVKCETTSGGELRTFTPRSDFSVSKSTLPRLLVEVNSKPKKDRPEDLVRMLLCGASVVRFANKFLKKFIAAKDFVLFAIYIWENGKVSRYSLYQESNNQEVRCNETIHWLNTSEGRAEFVRQLYNLRDMLERDEDIGDTEATINELQTRINKHNKKFPMKSFHTRTNKRKRSDSDVDGRSAGGGARDSAELGAHEYEVEPQDVVDEDGNVIMKPFFKMPSHILTVYQRSDQGKRFIAKKVNEQSNELEIFKILNTFQPKSEYIISLHESFQTQSTSWVIFPKMSSVAEYVLISPGKLKGKVAQVCWGLIKGSAYLHQCCIAHRDIKPENLVVDRNYSLKIIDFDVAVRVEGEDEVFYGQCGTEGWMAPEIEEKSMYSPIKADRWSTGRVLLYLLDNVREEDMVLRTTARELTAHDPEQRPSMLQVAASLSDVANVAVKRKALRYLQDNVEVDGENVEADGENAMPSRAKKLKLSAP